MKPSTRKYWFIGLAICTGSVTCIWQNSTDDQCVTAAHPGGSGTHRNPASRFTSKALLDNDTARFEPVSFERFRPQ